MVKGKQDVTVEERGNEQIEVPHPRQNQEEYERHKGAKVGTQRLDKRSAQGVSGLPKKSGQGGKFTWGGPLDEASQQDDIPLVLDKNDPNYVDEEVEELDRQVASSVVETPAEKSAQSPAAEKV